MSVHLSGPDWLALFGHFLSLSLLSIGGAITTAPEINRYLVGQQSWIDDTQFTASIALSQAAPGPNVLFIALLGWNVGVNAAGGVAAGSATWLTGTMGAFIAMIGMLLPSTTLTFAAARWGHRNREMLAVRAFKQGMAPIVTALLIATGWILIAGQASGPQEWRLWALTAATAALVLSTRIHILWLLGAGAILGACGWV